MRLDDATSAPLPEIPGHRTVSVAGAGSRARVYRARDLATQAVVAIKVFDPGPSTAAGIAQRIQRLRAGASGVGVVPRAVVETVGDRRAAYVMEFVDGDSLALALQRGMRFAPERAATIVAALATALGEVADAGLCHGNLHPGKVILSAAGPRLLGAGLGEVLPAEFEDVDASGRVSPHVYADNDALSGREPDSAADSFALGAILYHALTGIAPYTARTLAALRVERADGPLVWPHGASRELPPDLMKLVDRLTAPGRTERPAVGRSLASALGAAARRHRTPAPPVRERPPEDLAPQDVSVAATPVAASPAVERARALLGSTPFRWVVSASTAAVLLGGIALALRAGDGDESARRASGPAASVASAPSGERGVEQAATAEPAVAPAAVESPPTDPRQEELRAIEALFAEDSPDLAPLVPRLAAIAADGGTTGVAAGVLLSRVKAAHGQRAELAMARLLDRASALEAAGRYGDALAAIEEFPHEVFADTAASKRCALEADALRGRAAKEAYADVAGRAEVLAALGNYGAARALYHGIRDSIGLPTWIERADQATRELGRREEEAAAQERSRKSAEAAKVLHEDFVQTFRGISRSCRAFRYTEAEKALGELAAQPLDTADRERLTGYADLVSREAAQFRLIGTRLRSGARQGFLNFADSPRALVIRDVTEDGLELSGLSTSNGTLRSRFAWSRLPDYQAFKLMLEVGSELTSLDERIALAVFTHHRGLPAERENELRVADDLARSKGARDLVERVRRTLSTIDVDR